MDLFNSCSVSTDVKELEKLLSNAVEHLEKLRLSSVDEVSDEVLENAKMEVYIFKCLLFVNNVRYNVFKHTYVNKASVKYELNKWGLL